MKWTMRVIAVTLLFGCGAGDPAGADKVAAPGAAVTACGENVRRIASVWQVSPSGAEDTAALQCAIDEASQQD